MTDAEILELAKDFSIEGELIGFARAVAAKEREACAKECENLKVGLLSYDEIDEYIQDCADAIRARAWLDVEDATKWVDDLRDEEWTPEDMAYRPSGLSLEESPNSTTDVVEPIGEIQTEQMGANAMRAIVHFYNEPPPAGTKLYAAPPITDVEPVAWVKNLTDPQPHCVTDLAYRSIADILNDVEYVPLYTAPPQREWVGLTDEDYKALEIETLVSNMGYREVLRWADKRLKEKNHVD